MIVHYWKITWDAKKMIRVPAWPVCLFYGFLLIFLWTKHQQQRWTIRFSAEIRQKTHVKTNHFISPAFEASWNAHFRGFKLQDLKGMQICAFSAVASISRSLKNWCWSLLKNVFTALESSVRIDGRPNPGTRMLLLSAIQVKQKDFFRVTMLLIACQHFQTFSPNFEEWIASNSQVHQLDSGIVPMLDFSCENRRNPCFHPQFSVRKMKQSRYIKRSITKDLTRNTVWCVLILALHHLPQHLFSNKLAPPLLQEESAKKQDDSRPDWFGTSGRKPGSSFQGAEWMMGQGCL